MNRTFAVIWTSLGLVGSAGIWLLLWSQLDFANPEFFWLLLVIPLVAYAYVSRLNKPYASVKHSIISPREREQVPFKAWARHLFFGLKLIGITLVIIALARPQDSRSWEDHWNEGINIVIALDVSKSMLDTDIRPNRLEVSKAKAMEFIASRPHDRIGLVIYEGEAYTQAPLTVDHELLLLLFSEVRHNRVQGGTAIGNALATSVSRLRACKEDSKVVILLSDGVNDGGSIAPQDAIAIAKEYGVRVYTIGVGSRGIANGQTDVDRNGRTYQNVHRAELDEALLTQIAEETGGAYFTARSARLMEQVYREIDSLEKSRIETKHYGKKKDLYLPLALSGLGLILMYFVLYTLVFRIIE